MKIKNLNWLRGKTIIDMDITEDWNVVHYFFWRKSEFKINSSIVKWATTDWYSFIYSSSHPNIICVTKKPKS